MIFSKSKLSYLFIFIVSLFFSFFPLELIKGKVFIDRQFYIDYLTYYSNRLEKLDLYKVSDYISNEWLWHEILFFLKDNLYFSPNLVFSLISFFCFFIAALIVYSKTNNIFWIFLLFNPIFIDFYYSQLRLAFAFSLWGHIYYTISIE